jgi:CBS domain-containing protein
MKTLQQSAAPAVVSRLSLWAETAADLMTPNPVSLRDGATVREALALFTDKGFSAAPVIDEAGRPVGVLSRFDMIVHDRESPAHLTPADTYFDESDLTLPSGEAIPAGFQVERADTTRVRDLMTPAIFAVAPMTPACEVIEEMLTLKVHRLFVVDGDGVLVGVVSAMDVLKHLR